MGLFNERYRAMPMACNTQGDALSYTWDCVGPSFFNATRPQNAVSYHQWALLPNLSLSIIGATLTAEKHTIEYHVQHEQWPCAEVSDYDINLNFADTYGKDFGLLDNLQPEQVLYTPGSMSLSPFQDRSVCRWLKTDENFQRG